MTDRPISMKTPEIRALLAGTKTQARQVLKKQDWPEAVVRRYPRQTADVPYQVGDRLRVREACIPKASGTIYRADYEPLEAAGLGGLYGGWMPSTRMPRRASRLTLIVTDVRVQRLQDISEEDAIAEGVYAWARELMADPGHTAESINAMAAETGEPPGTTRTGFAALWNNIHGPGAWQRNPWCAAIAFDVRYGNIDQVGFFP